MVAASLTKKTGLRFGGRVSARWALVGFLIPSLVYVALFFGYPVYKDIVISFQNYGFTAVAAGHGSFVGWNNYRAMLASSVTMRALVNTLAFTVASVVFQFSIGFGMALYLNKNFAGASVLRRVMLIPWIMPLVVTGTMFSLIFSTLSTPSYPTLETSG